MMKIETNSPAIVELLGSFLLAILTFGFLLVFPEDFDKMLDGDMYMGIFIGIAMGLTGVFKLTYSYIWTYIILLFVFRKKQVAAFNPLFAIGLLITRKLDFPTALKVILGQLIGYFVAIFLIFILSEGIQEFDMGEFPKIKNLLKFFVLGFSGGLFLTYVFLQMKIDPPTQRGDFLFLVIPITYLIVLSSLSLSNPAIAVALSLPVSLFTDTSFGFLLGVLLLQIGPIVGAIVASIMFGQLNNLDTTKFSEIKAMAKEMKDGKEDSEQEQT